MKNDNILRETMMTTARTKCLYPILRHFCALTMALVFCATVNAKTSTKQMSFASPEEAVKTLVSTVKDGEKTKLMQILGPDAKPLLESGDVIQDKENREKFVKAYEDANKLDKSNESKVMLEIGKDEWPFPIPLVKEANGWRFDTDAGKDEILKRRVGRNELSTIQSLLAYVDAQYDYYLANPQHDKLNSYAQKFLSTKDKRDGLYYPVKESEKPSPLGELYAKARAAGYGESKTAAPQAYYGYYYRILTSQGPDAKGGASDYVIQGKMIGGHAAIAWPASYGNSGVMTFMVNQDGMVYEKNLGKNTNQVAKQITKFNPDQTWKKTKTD